ncbi:hypothetical protein M2266_001974 [Streptomyces sp. SPB162]|nr:hypothetical protein [Streptomyces sp. SPB162]
MISFDAGGFPAPDQSILYAGTVVQELDTVQLDTADGAEFIDAPNQLVNYRRRLDLMDQAALSPAASRDFISRIAHDL